MAWTCPGCRRWLEGEAVTAVDNAARRYNLYRQIEQGHCDDCHPHGVASGQTRGHG